MDKNEAGSSAIGGRKGILEAGEEAVVPPGIPHTFWNAGEEELHHLVELRPTLESERFFETVFGLQRDGKLVEGRTPNPLMMAPVIVEYENWLAGPPMVLQKLLFPPLALLGRLLGYRASYPQYSTTPEDNEQKEDAR